jgi:predicted metalloprotease with PDZ domain
VAAWDAEEKGLFGSKYWVSHPTVPLEKIVACFDLDMIGRLRNDQLYVYGARSGCGWRRLVARQNDELGLQIDFSWEFKPDADYYPFYEQGVPVLLFHTGLHDNYHRPSDTADLISGEGMSRVVRLLFATVYELAESDEKIPYRKAAGRETPETERFVASQIVLPAERLGATLDAKPAVEGGVSLLRVKVNSPADKAGLKPGDRILSCAGRDVHIDDDLIGAVMTAESPATLLLQRKGENKPAEISLELAGRPLRLGITWRVDDAEPGTIILTHVVPGTPAARAGLQAGDRIYQIAGRDFADENAFIEMLKTPPDPLELLVERSGKLRTVVIQFKPAELLKRAA